MSVEMTGSGSSSSMELPETPKRELAIEVRDLSKTYRIPTQRIDTAKERFARPFHKREERELHALRGVSFEVERGEFFGIVGRNGSGKSTLLKLLASIYRADSGRIRIAGRVAPFIELGVGFNLDMNAYDNIVLNGVMMGLSPREARSRFEEVVEFAELEQFTEMKLKNYSSGMLVRLGFSLLTQVDAEVLLVDEVLAVGDAAFQQKCFEAFGRLHQEGRTIVLVTHDMVAVQTHCDRAILLEDGGILKSGQPGEVAHRYLELNFTGRRASREAADVEMPGSAGIVRFEDVGIVDADGERCANLTTGEPIRIRAVVSSHGHLANPSVTFQIVNVEGQPIFGVPGIRLADRADFASGQRISVRADAENRLTSGHYFIHASVWGGPSGTELIAFRKHAADFIVYGSEPFLGMVTLDYEASASVENAAGVGPGVSSSKAPQPAIDVAATEGEEASR